MKKLNILLASLVFVAMGCSSKQDPMAGKPQAVRDGRLPVQKVELPAPKESEAVRIDVSVSAFDFVTFNETVEGRIPISARVLEKDYEVTYEIVNENEFPGATIDSTTGEFVWTPPEGFIFGGTQTDDKLSVEMKLTVRAIAKHKYNADAAIFTRTRDVNVLVQKNKGAPTMTVTGLTDDDGATKYFEEDREYPFEVKIVDADAGARLETQPRLEILPMEGKEVSLAPFIKIDTIKRDYKKHEFTYKLKLNLGKSNLTQNSSSAGFYLRAMSRFNVVTPLFKVESGVLAKFGTLDLTWKDEIVLVRGTKAVVPFLVYETTSRASFKAESVGMPPNSTIECNSYERKGILPCNFIWDIPANAPEHYGSFTITVTAHSDNYSSTINSISSDFILKYKVVMPTLTYPEPGGGGAGPTPVPVPIPTPHAVVKENL